MIFFLDFDGVVVTNHTLKLWKAAGSPQTVAGYASLLDPKILAAIDQMIQDCGGSVVISSTWRHLCPVPVVDVLQYAGFKSPVIGQTIQINDTFGNYMRGAEISAWMVAHQIQVQDVVILDDDSSAMKSPSDAPKHGGRVIQTDSRVGLTPKHLQRARKLAGLDAGCCVQVG